MARSYASDSNQKPIMNSRIDKDFSLSVDEKLCCRAMEVANKYDNRHELTSDHQHDEYTSRWKQTISGEINKLTWSNRFKVDKDNFLHEVLGPASVKEKLDFIKDLCGYSQMDKDDSLSNNEKLCYCAMEAANKYDNRHKLMSDTPSMLYSLIREIPEFFSQFIVDDRADQQMKKRQRV
jgi:hypothetical protein